MSMIEGVRRLLEILAGLGFTCTNLNSGDVNAQRKLSKRIADHQWLTIIIWTTVVGTGPLPKDRKPVKTLLVGNGIADGIVWRLKNTLRFRGKIRFAKRLRRRAELLMRLTESVQYCEAHHGPMSLVVSKRDVLCWKCIHAECDTSIPIDCALSDEIKNETSARFWDNKRQ